MTPKAKNNLIAIVAIVAGFMLSDTSKLSLPALPVSIPFVSGPSAPLNEFQKGVRSSMPDKAKARQLSLVAAEFARQVAFDGTLDEPQVNDTAQANALLSRMNQYAYHDETLATEAFRKVVGDEFNRRFQANGEGKDLTPENRKALVEFYEEIFHALE